MQEGRKIKRGARREGEKKYWLLVYRAFIVNLIKTRALTPTKSIDTIRVCLIEIINFGLLKYNT